MSNKDLIERLIRDGSRGGQGRPAGGGSGDTKDVETRVGAGVIRRRRADEPAPPAPPPAPPPAAAAPRPATAEQRTDGVIRRRPVAPTTGPTPAPSAQRPVAEEPVSNRGVAAPEPTSRPPVAAPPVVEPASEPIVQGVEEPTPVVEPVVAQAEPAVDVPAPESAPEPVAEPAQAAVAPVEVAPVAEAPVAPVEAPPVEAPAVQVAPVEEVAPAPVQAVEPAPVARPAPVEQRPPVRSSHATLASALPRADAQARRPDGAPRPPSISSDPAGRVPGLGKAVMRPPPGYDPNDPLAWRRRAPTAPEPAPPRPAQVTTAERLWGEAGAPTTPPPGDDADRPKRKGAKGAAARRGRVEMSMQDLSPALRRARRKGGKEELRTVSPQSKASKRRIEVDASITVASLAHAMSVKSSQVIKVLLRLGRPATVNEALDLDTAQIVASEFEYEVVNASFQETEHLIAVEEDAEKQVIRPPVVTIMGHVDHGKTTLLDAIRKTKVAAGEAGGITQHIGAYQVNRKGQDITFIDTPGHEAFTAMRARGARVTDIVVLVVAADDGVMPQTVEAINHAKAAGVGLMVAVNKCDKPNANPARVRQALMEHELVPEEYGGDTLFVDVSALKGKGIDDLLDAILLLAEVGEYTANPDRHGEGTVLEARLERGRGPVASLLVQKGTLKQGDSVVIGTTWGRVRAMTDHTGKKLKEAGPSTPVEITGLEYVPAAGDDFVVTGSDKDAKTLAEHRAELARQAGMAAPARMSLEDILNRSREDEKLVLNLVLKSDVGGSLEALKHAFTKIEVKGTELKVLHAGVGAVTESDVSLAHTMKAVIIGFNVRPDAKARQAADQYGVDIRTYSIIYDALDEVEKALKGMLSPVFQEKVQSNCQVLQTFAIPKIGTVAGCLVTEGKIARSHQVRLLRDGKIIWTGRLAGLRRFKDDVREVEKGYECGMNLDGYNDLKVGDIIESFTQEAVAPAT